MCVCVCVCVCVCAGARVHHMKIQHYYYYYRYRHRHHCHHNYQDHHHQVIPLTAADDAVFGGHCTPLGHTSASAVEYQNLPRLSVSCVSSLINQSITANSGVGTTTSGIGVHTKAVFTKRISWTD